MKFSKKVLGITGAAAVAASAVIGGVSVYAGDQIESGAEGIVAMHINGTDGGRDIQSVDYGFAGDDHGYTYASDLGVYPQNVYCILPTRNPGDDVGKNQHFRWRWNLNANAWVFDNNRNMLENQEYAPDSSQLEGLAAIINYGQTNGYSYGPIQDAVYWFVCYGNGSAPDYAGQQYQNEITTAYKNGEAKAPASYGLYMYIPDNEVTEMVQNTVGLAVWQQEEEASEESTESSETEESSEETTESSETEESSEETTTEETTTEETTTEETTTETSATSETESSETQKETETETKTEEETEETTEAEKETIKPETDESSVTVGELCTSVKVGDKTGTADAAVNLTYEEASDVTTVTDIISYSNLVDGAVYTVTGTIVEVDANGKITNPSVATNTIECAAEGVNGEWTMNFENVTLKAGSKYVVFESAYTAGGEDQNATKENPITHEDLKDLAQTIIVGPENERINDQNEEGITTIDNGESHSNDSYGKVNSSENNKSSNNSSDNNTSNERVASGQSTSTPATGDSSNVTLYIVGAAAVAGISATTLAISRKKKGSEK